MENKKKSDLLIAKISESMLKRSTSIEESDINFFLENPDEIDILALGFINKIKRPRVTTKFKLRSQDQYSNKTE